MHETFRHGVIKAQEGWRRNEKMQLGVGRDACKRSLLVAAGCLQLSTFIIISLPLILSFPCPRLCFSLLSLPLSSHTLIFISDGTNLRIKRRWFYDRHTFSFLSEDDISCNPNKHYLGFNDHLSRRCNRSNGKKMDRRVCVNPDS